MKFSFTLFCGAEVVRGSVGRFCLNWKRLMSEFEKEKTERYWMNDQREGGREDERR